MNVYDLEPDDYGQVTEESLFNLEVGELLHLSNRAFVYAQTDKNLSTVWPGSASKKRSRPSSSAA